jgi:cell division topological specificity factor
MSWFKDLLGKKNTADEAKNRLRLVLINDRAGISPGKLDEIRDDIIEVLSRHLHVNQRDIAVSLDDTDGSTRLLVDVPIAKSSRKN